MTRLEAGARRSASERPNATPPALHEPALHETDDSELVARCLRDDRQAFTELVKRYKNAMVNYLTRLVGCRDRAEDFAQETFVRFYQSLDRYRHEGQLAAYLYRIATNLVRSHERRKRRFQWLEPLLSRPGHHDETPQVAALASERQEQVQRAIAALDLHYRAPLVLREIEGRSYLEIAEALGCSEGTVKSRLFRARQILKDKLTPFWNGQTS